MATTFYLTTNIAGSKTRFGLGDNPTNLDGAASGWATEYLSIDRGAGVQTHSRATITGPTSGVEMDNTSNHLIHFVSSPLDRDVTISGTVTLNFWASETSMSANCAVNAICERIQGLTGNLSQTVFQTARTTELPTSEAAQNFTVTPTSVAFLKGDRIRLRVYADDSVSATMASGFSWGLTTDGTTSAASGDSFITFTETFDVLDTDPTGTTIYLTDTAAPDLTGDLDKEAWTSRGAGVVTSVTNTAAGYTSPIRLTDTAGGTGITWWTKQLQAVTLGGSVLVHLRLLESSTSANVTHRVEVDLCNADGSLAEQWARATAGTEAGTTETVADYYLGGADLAVTDGQRLRIRAYIDDCSPLTSAGGMVAGHTATVYYAGTSGGASGDSYLIFTQTLSEFVADTFLPRPNTFAQ